MNVAILLILISAALAIWPPWIRPPATAPVDLGAAVSKVASSGVLAAALRADDSAVPARSGDDPAGSRAVAAGTDAETPGAPVRIADPEHGGSSAGGVEAHLNAAVIDGEFDVVQMLLAEGYDVNARSSAGAYPEETPLHSVAYAGHIRIAELLLAYGADVDATDQYSFTPLRRSVEQGHLEMTALLINKGADIVAADTSGVTLMHVVARTNHIDIARLLITGGADINAIDSSGFAPLDYAQGGEPGMIETLARMGAACTIC